MTINSCTKVNCDCDSLHSREAHAELRKQLATWKRSHKNLRRKLAASLAEEARLRNHGGHDLPSYSFHGSAMADGPT